jgi:hypothetical protein
MITGAKAPELHGTATFLEPESGLARPHAAGEKPVFARHSKQTDRP